MAYQSGSVDSRSSLGIGESMNLFDMPSVDVGVSRVRYVEYKPMNQLNQDVGLEFEIPNNGNRYIDLRRTYLMCKVRIKQADGTDLPEVPQPGEVDADKSIANVAPVNNLEHSLYSQVDVYFQKKLVTTSNSNFAYEAYLNTLLKYERSAKLTHLQSQLWFKDQGNVEATGPLSTEGGSNSGLVMRGVYVSKSKTVDMIAPIMTDVMTMNRYLLNGIEVKLRFWPTSPAFHLMSGATDPKYKTELVDASLSVCFVTPTPELLISHQEVMSKKKWLAIYPYQKTDVKKYSISKGHFSFSIDNVYLGNVPTRLLVGLVSEEAANGSYTKNPFSFKHYDMKTLCITVDGESVPDKPFTMNYGKDSYESNFVEAYSALYGRERSSDDRDGGLDITRNDFFNGYTIYAFDMEPDIKEEDDGTVWPTFKKGNVRIDMSFAKATPETVAVILYATFPTAFKVDHTRAVILV